MKELNEAIRKWGKAIGKDVVKVDMFLNHRIDTALIFRMGEELADRFASARPDLILTVEASGIALALACARALGNIPVVFAKKGSTVVQNEEMVTSKVYSFTHKTENTIRVDRRYLPKGSRVLIVDDFLADGQAVRGMTDLCVQAGCTVCGVGIGIEKGFQSGGDTLRRQGTDLYSLAIVDHIDEKGNICLREA
ncbi:MAG: xanthine phosphoribosyltransferase [Clostridia bacterium]|nr:xanthine phosphoribosyltransferase [Clostridia bacterium]